MVLYRKYRPQSLDDLIGQEAVKQTLVSSLLSNKLSHAYLFCGPRGTGKTSTARILSKMVNCGDFDPKTGTPCNKCQICISITDGSNLDVFEIDAASNRGIDDIRSLRETIKLAPTSSPKKIYIIDEVHMLTTEAFNALLKTLEEPPTHVLFILATTELNKVPQTILSRVTKLDFKLASTDEIANYLKEVAKKEEVEIDDDSLKLLAKLSGGSFRDGVKLLDQVASMEKINVEEIEKRFGSTTFESVVKMLGSMISNDNQQALEVLNTQIKSGVAVKEFLNRSLDVLRNLLLMQNNLTDQLVKPNLPATEFHSLVELSKKIALEKIVAITDAFLKASEQLRSASIQTLPLEVAIIQSSGAVKAAPEKVTAVASEAKQSPASHPELVSGSTEMLKQVRHDIEASTNSSADIQTIKDKWQYILETIRPHNYSLEALLRSVKIIEVTDITVLVEAPYSFHQRILQAPKSKDLLESVLSDVLGRNIRISVSLGQRPVRPDDLANIELAQDDEIIRAAAEIFSADSIN